MTSKKRSAKKARLTVADFRRGLENDLQPLMPTFQHDTTRRLVTELIELLTRAYAVGGIEETRRALAFINSTVASDE
jgi:hypothetical protein